MARARMKEWTRQRSTEEKTASTKRQSGRVRMWRMRRFSVPSQPSWKEADASFEKLCTDLTVDVREATQQTLTRTLTTSMSSSFILLIRTWSSSSLTISRLHQQNFCTTVSTLWGEHPHHVTEPETHCRRKGILVFFTFTLFPNERRLEPN